MEAFKKILKNRRTLVFMDFEGTQFSHEIIAIGLVKTTCDENGIINGPYQTYKRYVKSYGPIGKIVTRITSITPEIIKNEGVTLEQALDEIKIFLGDEYENTAFIAFGSNDVKMIIDSIKLSKSIQQELKRVVDQTNNREIKPREDLYLLKDNDIPSVLIECGFLSNEKEAKMLIDEKYQEKIAWAIYVGIQNYFTSK